MQRIFLAFMLAMTLTGPVAADSFERWSDPTRPHTGQRSATNTPGDGMVLQSTLVSRERSMAVVNGRLYSTGDKIGRWQVMAIAPTEVVLRDAGEEKRLRLLSAISIKQQRQIVEANRHAAGS